MAAFPLLRAALKPLEMSNGIRSTSDEDAAESSGESVRVPPPTPREGVDL
jgi:hypothetical protein